jgi:hypothetical protein
VGKSANKFHIYVLLRNVRPAIIFSILQLIQVGFLQILELIKHLHIDKNGSVPIKGQIVAINELKPSGERF